MIRSVARPRYLRTAATMLLLPALLAACSSSGHPSSKFTFPTGPTGTHSGTAVNCGDVSLSQAEYDQYCSPSSQAGAPAAPNPVEILKKIPNCTLGAGITQGDSNGSGYDAHCDIAAEDDSGNQIDVSTYATVDDLNQALQEQSSDDSHKLIVGKGFILTDTGTLDVQNNSVLFDPPVTTLAQLVGGVVR